jgi:hypothetical protein
MISSSAQIAVCDLTMSNNYSTMLGYGQAAFRKGLMAARTGNGKWSLESRVRGSALLGCCLRRGRNCAVLCAVTWVSLHQHAHAAWCACVGPCNIPDGRPTDNTLLLSQMIPKSCCRSTAPRSNGRKSPPCRSGIPVGLTMGNISISTRPSPKIRPSSASEFPIAKWSAWPV